MIRKTALLLIYISMVLAASGQVDQKLIRGILLDINTFEPVTRASVITTISNKRMITNRDGVFRIRAQENDTLVISAIGYSTLTVQAAYMMPQHPDDSILILLTPVAYQLRDVDVFLSSPFRDSLARAVRFLKVDSLMNDHSRTYNRPTGKLYFGSGVIYEGFVQDLYNRFSKEGKENIHFEEFVKYSAQLQQADQRYNRDVVRKATGIEESRLDEFMLFCRLDKKFILNAPEYDLIMAIKKCGDEFKKK